MKKQLLLAALETFNQKHQFSVGDVVEWKPGMKNKRSEGPFIVSEVRLEPILDNDSGPSSPYFREPLDLVCGFCDSDGDFILINIDSRRLRLSE